MQQKKVLSVLLVCLLLVFSFQNCGPAYSLKTKLGASDLSSAIDAAEMGASTPNFVTNCMQSNYKACLPWKNPVASQGMSLTPIYTTNTDISQWRLHGVDITGYDQSGFLTNSTIDILPGGMQIDATGQMVTAPMLERVSTTTGNFKFNNNNDSNHKLRQVSAFYWLQFQNDFMTQRTGAFYANGKNIKVYTHNPQYANAAFDGIDQVIILGGNNGDAYAMHAEIIAHEMGHANIHFATAGAIWQMQGSASADVACLPNTASTVTCCPTRNGCVKAINEGQADYHAALMFAGRPQVGETWVNNPAGLKTPADDLYRDPTRNSNLTADEAYRLSVVVNGQSRTINGESRAMATLYTSIWWEMRKATSRVADGNTREMDELFTEHLLALTGSDTFVTARDKILAIDQNLFSGKYASVVQGEFARRGY